MTPYMTMPVWVIPAAMQAVLLLACVHDWVAASFWGERYKVMAVGFFVTAGIWLAYAVYWVMWWNTGGAMR